MRLLDRSLLGVVAISLLITVLFHINSSLANKDDYRDIFSNEEVDENKIISLLEKTITGNSIINEEKSIFIEPEIYKELEEKDKITVIIKLKNNFNPRSLEEIKSKSKENIDSLISLLNTPIESAAEDSVEPSTDNFEILLRYESLNAIAGKINNAGLEIIKNSGTVEAVYGERILHTNLQQSLPLINATQVWNTVTAQGNLTGAGQTVCIVDSGIDYNHQSLGGCLGANCKVKGGIDFVNMDFDPDDDSGHGTHIAGIVAANGNIRGVAPNADLIAVKVCDSQGDCAGTAMIAGVDYCISNMNSLGTDIITMSIGDGASYTNNNCPAWMNFAINFANSMNIPMTVSSGNDAHKNGISYPACAPNVISVGATYDANVGSQSYTGVCTDSTTFADKVTCFSNSGSNLDLMAPGAIITSTSSGTGNNCGAPNSQGSGNCSGTSMAAPHVAGTIALMKQLNPTMSPAEIETKLKQNGKIVTDMANGLNFSRIDAIKTIDHILTTDWLQDRRMTFDNQRSTYPKLGIDSTNNLHITWTDNRDSGNYEIYYKKLDNNGNILVNDKRITFASGESSTSNIVVDGNNNIHVAWHDTRNGGLDIYYKKLNNNGSTIVNDTRITYASSSARPIIKKDANNQIHMIWTDFRDGNPEIYYEKLDNNGNTIINDIRETYTSGSSLLPDMDIDNQGNIHVIWQEATSLNSNPTEIYYKKLDNNGNVLVANTRLTFITVNTAGSSPQAKKPSIRVDTQNGMLHIFWEDTRTNNGGATPEIFYTKLNNNGNTIIDDKRITFTSYRSFSPYSAVDNMRNIHLLWMESQQPGPGQKEVHYAKLDNNGDIIVYPGILATTSAIESYNAQYYNLAEFPIIIDSNNEIHTSFQDSRDGNEEIYYKRTMNNLNLEIPQNAVIGTTIPLHIKDIQHPNSYYILALAYGYSPGILLPDGRLVPLNPDYLLYASLSNYPLFTNFQGYLDSNGRATAYLTIPNSPQLAGTTIYAAFVTANSTAIQSVSPYFPIQITV